MEMLNWEHWLAGLSQRGVWWELLALALCLGASLAAVSALRRALGVQPGDDSVWLGRSVVDGVAFPLLLLVLTYVARALVARVTPLVLFKIAVPAVLSLVAIRVGVKVLHLAFRQAPWVRVLERTFSWLAWGAAVMWISGLLPVMLEEMEQVGWKVGGSTLTLRNLVEGALTAGVVLIVTLWISAAIESRLLHAAEGEQLSLRKAASNAIRAVLMTVGVMMALSAVGIDLTALSVLSGAIGVGIGFGLQKLAANYVSGFVILAERSVRIGDMVRVDNFEGRVTDITARYTVIRSLGGRESIVPNETMITTRVENLSLADPKVWQSTVVSVAYGSDVQTVREVLIEAAKAQPRVLADPPPSAALSNFGADGLEFTLGYWIADPHNGQLNVKSDINLAILRAFGEKGIEIPFPQRVIHQAAPRDGAAAAAAA